MPEDMDWEDQALKRRLGTIARESTKYIYRVAFKAYTLFSGMTASELIDEACALNPLHMLEGGIPQAAGVAWTA